MPLRKSECRVRTYPLDGGVHDLSDDVRAGSITRTITGDNSFSLSLIDNGNRHHKVGQTSRGNISIGDWIIIETRNERNDWKVRLIGRILNLSKSDVATRNAGRIHSINVSGMDFIAVFKQSRIVMDPWITFSFQKAFQRGWTRQRANLPVAPFVDRQFLNNWSEDIGSSDPQPHKILEILINSMLGVGLSADQRFALPAGPEFSAGINPILGSARYTPQILGTPVASNKVTHGYAQSIFTFDAGPLANDVRSPGLKGKCFNREIISFNMNGNTGGSLWDSLVRFSNPGINELFMEYPSGRPVLRFRENPFPCWTGQGSLVSAEIDSEAWDDLNVYEIDHTDISRENVSKSDNNRFNMFAAVPKGMGHMTVDMSIIPQVHEGLVPIIDFDSVLKHGARPMRPSVIYSGFESFNNTNPFTWVGIMAQWSIQLAGWFWLNADYLNGQIEVPFLNDGEVGRKLLKRRIDVRSNSRDALWDEYYIDGVTWSWSVSSTGATSGKTTYSVSRGQERFGGRVTGEGDNKRFIRTSGVLLPDAPGQIQEVNQSLWSPANIKFIP